MWYNFNFESVFTAINNKKAKKADSKVTVQNEWGNFY